MILRACPTSGTRKLELTKNYFSAYLFRGGNESGLWSTRGCKLDDSASNGTHSVCRCNHLTNFAILMKVKSDTTEVKDVTFHIIKPHILEPSVIQHTKSYECETTKGDARARGGERKAFPCPPPWLCQLLGRSLATFFSRLSKCYVCSQAATFTVCFPEGVGILKTSNIIKQV